MALTLHRIWLLPLAAVLAACELPPEGAPPPGAETPAAQPAAAPEAEAPEPEPEPEPETPDGDAQAPVPEPTPLADAAEDPQSETGPETAAPAEAAADLAEAGAPEPPVDAETGADTRTDTGTDADTDTGAGYRFGENVFRLGTFGAWTAYRVNLGDTAACLVRTDGLKTSYQRGGREIPMAETGLFRGKVYYSVAPDPDLGEIHYYNAGVEIDELQEIALFAGPGPEKFRFRRYQATTAYPEEPGAARAITRALLAAPDFYMASLTADGITVFDKISARGLRRALEVAERDCRG